MIALIVGALALGGAGYWLFLRPVPVATQTEQLAQDEEAAETGDDARPPATSPEARAWDAAAANTTDAPAPSPWERTLRRSRRRGRHSPHLHRRKKWSIA